MTLRLLIALLCIVSTAAEAQTTRSQVLWHERHSLRWYGGRRLALVPGVDGGYRVVGNGASYSNPNDKTSPWKEWWWILTLDRAGRAANFKEVPVKPNTSVDDAVIADGKLTVVGGMTEWLATVDDLDVPQPPQRIDGAAGVTCAHPDGGGTLVIAGSTYNKKAPNAQDAWLARVNIADGSILWQTQFDRGQDESAYSLLPTRDGYILFITSGKYDKFGTGPSALWLVRCDREGKKLAEVVIDGGRVMPSGSAYLAPCGDDGFVISYSTTDLSMIVGETAKRGGFDVRVARFDKAMNKLWDKELAPNSFISTALVTTRADGRVAVVTNADWAPVVTYLTPEGEVAGQVRLPMEGTFSPKDVLLEPDGLVVVGSFRARRDPFSDEVVLIFKLK